MAQQEHNVTALDAIEAGQMRAVEIEGQSVLLVRDGESVHALGATCPHAGGPLAEGVRCGDRLVCPWHKAAFSLRTGAVLEPPAMDPLPRHQVRIANGRVLVTLAEVTRREAASGDDRCFVIVGAGAAGAVAAQTLREAGFGGRVLMLDRDNRVPYDRTILSKYVLSGEKGGEKSPLQSQSFYRDQRIERITAEVSAVDAEARRITCTDGTVFAYDAALLATGGVPKRADIPGAGLGNVFLLRSRADSEAILAQAERSARAVILGASFIGMEVGGQPARARARRHGDRARGGAVREAARPRGRRRLRRPACEARRRLPCREPRRRAGGRPECARRPAREWRSHSGRPCRHRLRHRARDGLCRNPAARGGWQPGGRCRAARRGRALCRRRHRALSAAWRWRAEPRRALAGRANSTGAWRRSTCSAAA